MGFSFCAKKACYIMRRINAGVGTELTVESKGEKRVALEYIAGPGTDQGTEREKRVGEIYIFFYFLRDIYNAYYEKDKNLKERVCYEK